jgi:hypothetical protein
MAAKASTATPTRTRATVVLPQTVTSEEVEFPGGGQGRGSANAELRASLTNDVAGMTKGSARRYNVTGEAQQKSFLNLFRSVVDTVHNHQYGVRAVMNDNGVFIKLDSPIKRTRKVNGSK